MANICPVCKYATPVDRYDTRPGNPVLDDSVTTHYNDCSTIPRMSREAELQLQERLDEIARCQRRAWAGARNYVIG